MCSLIRPLDILSIKRLGSTILSATTRFAFLVMISFAAIVNLTVDLVGEFLCSIYVPDLSDTHLEDISGAPNQQIKKKKTFEGYL